MNRNLKQMYKKLLEQKIINEYNQQHYVSELYDPMAAPPRWWDVGDGPSSRGLRRMFQLAGLRPPSWSAFRDSMTAGAIFRTWQRDTNTGQMHRPTLWLGSEMHGIKPDAQLERELGIVEQNFPGFLDWYQRHDGHHIIRDRDGNLWWYRPGMKDPSQQKVPIDRGWDPNDPQLPPIPPGFNPRTPIGEEGVFPPAPVVRPVVEPGPGRPIMPRVPRGPGGTSPHPVSTPGNAPPNSPSYFDPENPISPSDGPWFPWQTPG